MTVKTDAFIALIAPAAQRAQIHSGIPASVTIAQAAIETGWGAAVPISGDVNSHNLFGIKADASWHGPRVVVKTHEVVSGHPILVSAAFRVYADWQESIEDRCRFFYANPRYQEALTHLDNGIDFARYLAAAGYATDPDYALKLISTINAHELLNYDQPRTEWALLPWALQSV
jgi:flagellar protein FlgJ